MDETMNVVDQFRRVPEIQGARQETLERMAGLAGGLLELPAGADLYATDSASDEVFVLLGGSIRLWRRDLKGEPTVLETRKAPALVGEAAALDGGLRTVTATAEDAVRVLPIPADPWRACLREDAALGLGLANRLAAVLRQRPVGQGEADTTVKFTDRILPAAHDNVAPDRSLVRILAQLPHGGMAHFELGPEQISTPQRHRTVSEIWYVLSGLGVMWRQQDGEAAREIDLRPGVSLTIPVGTSFQFKNTGREPLAAIGVTMPPWPGDGEAFEVTGPWTG
ncbi:cyclic nucleotide-binding domain-containing protein [Kribbella sp. CA-247076]|uniref:cyclic nucleotide-binding domain-containing protein n=1 Tax=Kribbella sp. CA-247076 TaxID=3239941 RepID=UPI003D91EFDD